MKNKKTIKAKLQECFPTQISLARMLFYLDPDISREEFEEKILKLFPDSRVRNNHFYWYKSALKGGDK